MATVAEEPKPKKLSKPLQKASALLDKYAELHQQKAELKDGYDLAVAPLDEKMNEVKTKLEAWSKLNEALFGGKKTMTLDGGTFGSKLGAKAVAFPLDATADIKDKYQKLVKAELPAAIVESVDAKRVIVGCADDPKLAAKLGKLGITVKQESSFYITPKK